MSKTAYRVGLGRDALIAAVLVALSGEAWVIWQGSPPAGLPVGLVFLVIFTTMASWGPFIFATMAVAEVFSARFAPRGWIRVATLAAGFWIWPIGYYVAEGWTHELAGLS